MLADHFCNQLNTALGRRVRQSNQPGMGTVMLINQFAEIGNAGNQSPV